MPMTILQLFPMSPIVWTCLLTCCLEKWLYRYMQVISTDIKMLAHTDLKNISMVGFIFVDGGGWFRCKWKWSSHLSHLGWWSGTIPNRQQVNWSEGIHYSLHVLFFLLEKFNVLCEVCCFRVFSFGAHILLNDNTVQAPYSNIFLMTK